MPAVKETLPPLETIDHMTSTWYPAMYRTKYGAPSPEVKPHLDIRGMCFDELCLVVRSLSPAQRRELVAVLADQAESDARPVPEAGAPFGPAPVEADPAFGCIT